jgi:hypothetical protein
MNPILGPFRTSIKNIILAKRAAFVKPIAAISFPESSLAVSRRGSSLIVPVVNQVILTQV